MKIGIVLMAAFSVSSVSLCAQNKTPQDSLALQKLLQDDGEIKLNPIMVRELEREVLMGRQRVLTEKAWLEFDASLSVLPQAPVKRARLTLRPYTATTKYNWDPVYGKKIEVKSDTWRCDPFSAVTRNDKPITVRPSGLDFMAPFTREFWNVKGRKRRARTLEVLRTYGDSTHVMVRHPVLPVSE